MQEAGTTSGNKGESLLTLDLNLPWEQVSLEGYGTVLHQGQVAAILQIGVSLVLPCMPSQLTLTARGNGELEAD